MNFYSISENELKDLLYEHYVLGCLEEAGVDNWFGYMENREEYINSRLGIEDPDNWNEEVDFEDLVEIDLTKYKKIN